MDCNTSQLLTRVSEVGSLVVFSPTRDGRVWDIQLEIIATVLRTAPSFSSGGLIAVELMSFHSDWLSSQCRLAVRGVTAAHDSLSGEGEQGIQIESSVKNTLIFIWSLSLLLLTMLISIYLVFMTITLIIGLGSPLHANSHCSLQWEMGWVNYLFIGAGKLISTSLV